MPDNLSWNKDSNTKKSEQQNLKHPYAYQHTQWQKKETKIIPIVKE